MKKLVIDAVTGEQSLVDATVEPVILPVPDSISDRQFFHALAKQGVISQAEALAAVRTGDIPPTLQTFVDALPDENSRFDATMLLSGAVAFERSHPLTAAIGMAQGWTEEQINDFFRFAASL